MDYLMNYISITVGIIGAFYAILSNRQKAKMENMVRIHLSGIAGDIQVVRENTGWGWEHLNNIQNYGINIEPNELKEKILKSAQLGGSDVAAANRMLGNLFNRIVNTQEGMFGTNEVRCLGKIQEKKLE